MKETKQTKNNNKTKQTNKHTYIKKNFWKQLKGTFSPVTDAGQLDTMSTTKSHLAQFACISH
jgi:hypothetical protein